MNAEVLIKFKGDSTDAEKKTNNLSTSLGNLVKSFTLANVAAKGIEKAMQIFNENLDGAIRRVDALNNFPKVMSNLNIGAGESAEVISDLSEKLKGLPTALDTAAMAVQRLTSKNGNVKQSEQIFLALNNAILAGGASADIQANAMEQMAQAYAKGKPDMMEWRSMMTAMPAQLKQVAIAMGYTDSALLGEAVRAKDGQKEFSRMIDTMMRMNTEGVAGFKSFDEQARNATGGINTSVTNMKTAFIRGVADMINKVDSALQPFGGLNGVISNIGKTGEQVFKKIGDVLSVVIPKMIEFGQWVQKNEAWLKPLVVVIGTFIATFMTINKVIKIIKAVKVALAALSSVMSIMAANHIVLIIAAIAALVAGFIYLWNNCEAFRNFFIGLWEGIKKVVGDAVNAIISVFRNAINGIMTLWNGMIAFFSTLWNTIKTIFFGVAEWINTNIIQPAMAVILPIVDFFQNLALLIIAIVAMLLENIYNVLSGIASWVYDHIITPIIAIFTAFVDFITTYVINPVVGFFQGAWNLITTGVHNFIEGVKSVFGTIANFVRNNVINPVVNFFTNAFNNIYNFVKDIIEKIKSAFGTIKDAVAHVFTGLRDIVKNLFLTIGNVIKAPINGIISAVNGVIDGLNKIKVPDWVPGIGGAGINFKKLPMLNVGTNYVPEDQMAIIHKGEAVIPKKFNPYANGMKASTIGTMQNNNMRPIINVYADFETDPLGQVVSKIKTFSGGAKNDYNYGKAI